MKMELVTILMRTLFTYFFMLVLLRLMGKREIGKMSVFDMVISIMLAEMAAMGIENVDKPATYFLLPMALLAALEFGMSLLSLKSKKVRDVVEGSAELIIEKGQIREEAMKRNRLSLDDLMVGLRQKNISNLADVEFALLEPNGLLSVFPKKDKLPVTLGDLHMKPPEPVSPVTFKGIPIPLIMDGKIRDEALRKIGQNAFWLKKEIRKYGIDDIKSVSFCTIDDQGILYIDQKDRPRPKR